MSLRLLPRQSCRPYYRPIFSSASNRLAQFSHAAVTRQEKAEDPRLKEEFGDLVIEDQYAILREKYGMLRESKPMAEPRISQLLTPRHLTYSF
jgi:triacylglycerol lipase